MEIMNFIFDIIAFLDDFYWSYIGWVLILAVGLYLTWISKGLQFRALFNFRSNIKAIYSEASENKGEGIHPFKLYFASVGGMVGLGNIVGISVAMMIGGPGSIFWTIIASLCGMLLKYSEIFLGVKHRIRNNEGGFDGGPMYYLKDAFGKDTLFGRILPALSAVIICLYGVETLQFLILVDRIEATFEIDRFLVVIGLLAVVIYSSIGGIKRLANICTYIMPGFMLTYIFMSGFIIISNASMLPEFFALIIKSAFTSHAEMGGFAGSTMILAAYLGMSKTVYSGDIGVGYDAIVQSETRIVNPKKQAVLAIYSLLTDTFICLMTNIMVGVTGAWYTLNHMKPSDVVSSIIGDYFPYSELFMTLLLFFAGFTTLIAFLAAGIKCARYLNPRHGKKIYLLYAVFAFIVFSGLSQDKLIAFMGLISGLLVLINVAGILKLRKEIDFK